MDAKGFLWLEAVYIISIRLYKSVTISPIRECPKFLSLEGKNISSFHPKHFISFKIPSLLFRYFNGNLKNKKCFK